MSLPDFQVLRPRTVAEAVDLLGKYAGEVQVIAGGTDLIPSLRQRLFAPKYVLDIGKISELRGIRPEHDCLIIGAGTSLNAIEHSDVIRRDYPVLAVAAAAVASPLLRNMGTLGGNICLNTRCVWYNQSLTWRKTCNFCIKKDGDLCHVAPGGSKCWASFSADTPPALLCLGAELEIVGPGGARRIAIRNFYTNLGDAPMKLGKDELLTRISLPTASAGYHGTYRKLRIRGSIDYPLAGLAVALKYSNGRVANVRLAITAVNPAPLLVRGAEELLTGKPLTEDLASAAGELAAKTAKPLTTSALTPEYRREMVRVLTKRALLDQ
ncbi:MAG TPA: FAD binding domain-containing protein, partial [Terriglobales bacterium]|nr:FAD binding domain-containing protein [Terriglobales bacterium]